MLFNLNDVTCLVDDPIVYFALQDISIEDIAEENKPEYRVFSVSAGDYKIPYYLQLAHTTNIPLKYEIYQVRDLNTPQEITVETGEVGTTVATVNGDVTTVIYNSPLDNKAHSYSFTEEDKKELVELNVDANSQTNYGRKTAARSGNFYDKTYLNEDAPELYAIPIYLQTKEAIRANIESDDHDYFVLKLSFDSADTDKEPCADLPPGPGQIPLSAFLSATGSHHSRRP